MLEELAKAIPWCRAAGIGLLPWSPLAGGFLSGKYERDGDTDEAQARYSNANPMFQYIGEKLTGTERNWATLAAVRQIAAEAGATPSQVALSWVTDQPSVSSTIIGARTIEQLRDNLAATALKLDEGALATLDAVSAPKPDEYPYGRFGSLQRHRYVDSSDQALREL
jgi:aryl-alcohol dehydrogenase-like predicted oxidoreductase